MSDPIESPDTGPVDPLDGLDVPPARGPQFQPPGSSNRASVLPPQPTRSAGRGSKIALIVALLLVLLGGFAIWRKSQPQPVAMPEFTPPPVATTVPVEPAPDVKDLLVRLDGLHESLNVLRAETAQALREQKEALGQLQAALDATKAHAVDGKLLEAVQALGQRLQGLETSVQGLGQRLAVATAPKPAAKPAAQRPAVAPWRIEAVNYWDSVPYVTIAGTGMTLRAGDAHKGWTLVDVENGRAILRGPDGRRVVQAVPAAGR